jgi:hypothetical protein
LPIYPKVPLQENALAALSKTTPRSKGTVVPHIEVRIATPSSPTIQNQKDSVYRTFEEPSTSALRVVEANKPASVEEGASVGFGSASKASVCATNIRAIANRLSRAFLARLDRTL